MTLEKAIREAARALLSQSEHPPLFYVSRQEWERRFGSGPCEWPVRFVDAAPVTP
jgi:hypothetical protein